MIDKELAVLLVETRRVMGTPFITINDRGFYVMLPYEALGVVETGELQAEDFESFRIGGNIFYIAEVTL